MVPARPARLSMASVRALDVESQSLHEIQNPDGQYSQHGQQQR